jgi:hypothetical protein
MLDSLALLAMVMSGALIFAAARTATGAWPAGAFAAIAFAISPLLWSDPPQPASLYPLPFVCAWLWASAMWLRRGERVWALVAGGLLGAGVYASPGSVVMMPAYAAVTVAIVASSGRVPSRHWMAFIGLFTIVAASRLIWWLIDPAPFRAIVTAHHLYDAERFNVLQGIREVTSWVGLTARSEVFWDYLNPAFLFVTGRVLSWPLAVLLPLGLYFVAARDTSLMGRLVLAAFVIAPLAASLPAEPPVRGRIAWILPAAALLAMFGAEMVRRRLSPTRA